MKLLNAILLILASQCVLFSQRINLEPFATGLSQPVDITNAGDDRLFVVEKRGLIRTIQADGSLDAEVFLDIDDRVNSGANERGLLGLAFHPEFSLNGFFFVNYTGNNGTTIVSRFRTNNLGSGDPDTEEIIISIDQPYNNHNGGCIKFGHDGYLYIGMGDGGSGGDPQDYGQNRLSLLGKMLRLDVDNGLPYTIPADNPFANTDFTLDEIWAIGLRNPWRFSFDRHLGDMWIGDVGQKAWEEINFQSSDSQGGENYGWRCYEGYDEFNLDDCSDIDNYTFPVFVYENSSFNLGCSVTGGYVYRGSDYPALYGRYIFADYCTGQFWTSYRTACGDIETEIDMQGDFQEYAAFGEDVNGELYVAGLGEGDIQKITSNCLITTSGVYENANCTSGGSIVLTVEGPANYTVSWNTGATTEFISDLEPGCYCATISYSDADCSETRCFEIAMEAHNFPPDLGPSAAAACAPADPFLLEVNLPGPDYQIQWYKDGIAIDNGGNPNLEVTEGGLYSLHYIYFNCISDFYDIIDYTLIEPPTPVISQDGSSSTLIATDGFAEYQWYLAGMLVATSYTNILDNAADGVYTVIGIDQNGCLSPSSEEFLLLSSTVIENDLFEKLIIQPNPFDNFIDLDIVLRESAVLKFELLNINGQQILKENIGLKNQTKRIIDTNELLSGIYIIKIGVNDKSILQKLVKI